MKLIDRTKQTLNNLTGKRWFGVPTEVDTPYIEYLGKPSRRSQSYLKEYKDTVYACITTICDSALETDWFVKKQLASGEMQKINHSFTKLLNNPNPDLTKEELIETTLSFYELQGECFWYFALGERTGLPKEIYILRPDKMKIAVDPKTGEVIGYSLMKENGNSIDFSVNEIMHFKRFNPNNPYRGMGTVEAALTYIETETFATRFTRNFLYNNATPAGIITLKGDVPKATYDSFKRRWRDGMSGTENAGKVAIVRKFEAEFTKIGMSLGDIDLKALRDLTEADILKMFRVPKAMLGFSDSVGLGRGNIEALEYIFNKRVVNPKLEKLDGALQRKVDTFYKGQDLVIGHTSIVPADKEFELKERAAGYDRWITRNEIREQDGNDPKPGGDDLYYVLNQVPGESTPSQKTYSIKVAKPEVKKELDIVVKENFRKSIMGIQQAYEGLFQKKVVKLIADQEKSVLAKFKKGITAKAFEEQTFDPIEESKKFVSTLSPISIELMLEIGPEALLFAGDTESQFVLSEAVKAQIKERMLKTVNNFNSITVEKLSKTLVDGFQNGESIAKIRKRVESVFTEAKGYRAERIARTETLFASNDATEIAYQTTGYVTKKEWYTNPGACEHCKTMDGKIVSLGQPFVNKGDKVPAENGKGDYLADYMDVNYPPLHPDCRCTIIPVSDSSKEFNYETISDTVHLKRQIKWLNEEIIQAEENKNKEIQNKVDQFVDSAKKEREALVNKLEEVLDEKD